VTPINDAAAQLTTTTSQLSQIISTFGAAVENVGKKLEEIRSPEDVVRAELAPAIAAIKDMSEAQLQPLRNIELALGRMAEAMGQAPAPKPQAEGDIAAEPKTVPRKRWWRLW